MNRLLKNHESERITAVCTGIPEPTLDKWGWILNKHKQQYKFQVDYLLNKSLFQAASLSWPPSSQHWGQLAESHLNKA